MTDVRLKDCPVCPGCGDTVRWQRMDRPGECPQCGTSLNKASANGPEVSENPGEYQTPTSTKGEQADLDSPNWLSGRLEALAARHGRRVNDPRDDG